MGLSLHPIEPIDSASEGANDGGDNAPAAITAEELEDATNANANRSSTGGTVSGVGGGLDTSNSSSVTNKGQIRKSALFSPFCVLQMLQFITRNS